MPVQSCKLPSGGSGFKWGTSGKCYSNKPKAVAQGQAIEANKQLFKALGSLHEKLNEEKTYVKAQIITKSGDEKRLFYAVVLEPETEVTDDGDAHGDTMTVDEVEKSAHYFMEMGSTVFKNHQNKIDAKVVESYISPVEFTPEGSETVITKGSWVMTVKIFDDDVWEAVKKGEITAFSPGGYANRIDVD